jgi:hypothetical protein
MINKNKVKDLIYDYDEMLIAKIYYKYNDNGDILKQKKKISIITERRFIVLKGRN